MAVPERRDRVERLVLHLNAQGVSPAVVYDHDHIGPWRTNQACWDVVSEASGPDGWGLVLEDDVLLGQSFVARALALLAELDGTEPVTFFSTRPECGRVYEAPDGTRRRQRAPYVRLRGRHFSGTLAMAMRGRVARAGLEWIRSVQGTDQEPSHWSYHGDERWRTYFGGACFVCATPSLVQHDDGGKSVANPQFDHRHRGAVWFEG
jgi:hypothetical protein